MSEKIIPLNAKDDSNEKDDIIPRTCHEVYDVLTKSGLSVPEIMAVTCMVTANLWDFFEHREEDCVDGIHRSFRKIREKRLGF